MHEELLKYHPHRFVDSRPLFPSLFNIYRKTANAEGVAADVAIIQINQKLGDEWNAYVEGIPIGQRPIPSASLLTGETSLISHISKFRLMGRNIFHFSQALTSLLKLTDVDEVLWGSIALPYAAFYLYFGPQEEWRFGNGRYKADGAYISGNTINGHVEILVTTVDSEIDYTTPPSWLTHRDFYYYISFECDSSKTVGESLSYTIGTDSDFDRNYQPPEIAPEMLQMARERGAEIVKPTREDSSQMKVVEERIADLPIFRQVLRLLINGVCYLSTPSREIVRRYPQSVELPINPAVRKREVHRLKHEGYTEINFCGESLDREYQAAFTGKELSTHWRRGHWRNQACGPKLSEHRNVWIRPTLVRKDKQADDIPGHIYRAEV